MPETLTVLKEVKQHCTNIAQCMSLFALNEAKKFKVGFKSYKALVKNESMAMLLATGPIWNLTWGKLSKLSRLLCYHTS